MICPKCGHETSGNFCNNCGALLRRGTSPAVGENRGSAGSESQNIGGPGAKAPGAKVPGGEAPGTKAPGAEGFGTKDRRAKVRQLDGISEAGGLTGSEAGKGASDMNLGPSRMQAQNRMESREERRDNIRRREKPGNHPGKRSALKDSGSSSAPGRKELRLQQKEKKLRDSRMRELESEVGRLKAQERLRESRRAEEGEYDEADPGPDLGRLAAKGAAGAVILLSRGLQLLSFLLMGCMVLIMLRSYLAHETSLGELRYIAAERNYGLALYAGAAAASLFIGVIWCLWILSRRGAGGGFRLKKYDTGRGLIPFLLCAAFVYAAGPASAWIPSSPAVSEEWRGIVAGASAFLTAVNVHRSALLFCSGAGAVLSLIRRVLLV